MSHKNMDVNVDASMKVLEEFLTDMEASKHTISCYQRHISAFCKWSIQVYGSVDLTKLTHSEIQTYVQHLQKQGAKPSTVNAHLSALRSIGKYTGQIEPFKKIRKIKSNTPAAPQSLDRLERLKLLRDVEKRGDKRDIAIIYTLLYTGIRVSELCDLNQTDLDIGERHGTLFIREGKGNKQRNIPLPIEARNAISNYLNDEYYMDKRIDNDSLFITNRGTRIQTRTVQRICEQLGTHPHALRHTYIRRLVASGADLVSVSRLAGHTSVNTTALYATPDQKELQNIIEKAFTDDI